MAELIPNEQEYACARALYAVIVGKNQRFNEITLAKALAHLRVVGSGTSFELYEKLAAERTAHEQTRVQLAGCAAAALGASPIAQPGDYGWSASYRDVRALRERYDSQALTIQHLKNKLEAKIIVAVGARTRAAIEKELEAEQACAPAGPFVSKACDGERCSVCGKPATAKLGEEILFDDPMPERHNATAYVCAEHFLMVFGTKTDSAVGQTPTTLINEREDARKRRLDKAENLLTERTSYPLGAFEAALKEIIALLREEI